MVLWVLGGLMVLLAVFAPTPRALIATEFAAIMTLVSALSFTVMRRLFAVVAHPWGLRLNDMWIGVKRDVRWEDITGDVEKMKMPTYVWLKVRTLKSPISLPFMLEDWPDFQAYIREHCPPDCPLHSILIRRGKL